MKIFLDANVLVSVLNKEYPLFTYTSRILSLIENRKYVVYTSPLCLDIAFYFAEKKNGTKAARRKIEILSGKIKIAPVDQLSVKKAVENKMILDFEDGLQYYAAENVKCQCIITEDVDDFFFSKMEVLRSKDFIEKYVI